MQLFKELSSCSLKRSAEWRAWVLFLISTRGVLDYEAPSLCNSRCSLGRSGSKRPTFRGSINGTVVDPSVLLFPNAQVKATESAQD